MINLIPPRAKKSLALEYWVRVASVWLYLWAFALFAVGCLLLPSYVLIGSQVDVYASSAEAASEKVATYENVSTSLVRASQEARALMDERGQARFSDYITLFRGLQGNEISLFEMRFGRGEGALSPIVLSGVADDRQALASFRDRVLAQAEVESVDLPISNLARDRDIQFTITVVLASPEDL